VARTLVSSVLVVGVALLMGYRPAADLVEWITAIGVVALLALALTWLAVAIGLLARNAEGTSAFTLIVQVLPFLSSAFVPTDSMSGGVRWFAQNEPFTPIIDTVRGLLTGVPIGNSGVVAVAWCVGLALAGFLWSRALFRRDPVR
jgi:ABC-2 type transport system permease protein